ncbi:PilW family protein [Teredinibacter sp. KSP-S5-2]|uniref:PilW family protein n=1 Tax=Teredinibacter sp. KSP-S5-2 TaxID=3034506 RepID=UPI0029346D06|nr:PilW family protein [Teredinibacter sp. KSP-S5-2]WNO09862.1 PilW family protein [Teredinibacter sp. KSP-S5-2]
MSTVKMVKKDAGFSLVELLVSILISMIIFGGVVNVILNSNNTYRVEEESTYIQENIRYSVDVLTRDIQHAGFFECGTLSQFRIANSIDNSAADSFLNLTAIEGYEGDLLAPVEYRADQYNDSDSILLRYADTSTEVSVASHSPNSAEIKLTGSHNFSVGTPLIVVDSNCGEMGFFSVSGPSDSSLPADHIVHNTGSGSNQNCTKVIKASISSFECDGSCTSTSCGGNSPAEYSPGSSVFRFYSAAYYIGNSAIIPGMPALKKATLLSSGVRLEELVQGVERMEVLYGVDEDIRTHIDNPNWLSDMGDGIIDSYQRADAVADWNQVLAVKVNLFFRSQGDVFDADQVTTLHGIDFGPDRFLWRTASLTAQIRSRSRRDLMN